jgi:hypothetical protein
MLIWIPTSKTILTPYILLNNLNKKNYKKKCAYCSIVEVYVLNYWYFYLLKIIIYKILKEKNTLYN